MTVAGNFNLHLDVSQDGSGNFPAHATGALDFVKNYANGVGADQFDLAYIAERTVLTAANDDIDLSGVLTDLLGSTITAVELVAIVILNRQKDGTVNTTNLTLGGGSNPVLGLFSSMVLRPGSVVAAVAGDAAGLAVITAATGDILRVANAAGATNKYMIAVLARSS